MHTDDVMCTIMHASLAIGATNSSTKRLGVCCKQIHRINMEARNLCKEKCDFNQNLIEPSRSYTQLCNMINQLEKDSNIEIAECNQLAVEVKYDSNLEQPLERYSEQVSGFRK